MKSNGPLCPHPDGKLYVPILAVLKLCKKLHRGGMSPSLRLSLLCELMLMLR